MTKDVETQDLEVSLMVSNFLNGAREKKEETHLRLGSDSMADLSQRLDKEWMNILDILLKMSKNGSSSQPRSHHVNPVFALGNFSEGDSRKKFRLIQHLDRISQKRKAEKVALIEDFNTTKILLQQDPFVVERYYSRIENLVAGSIKNFDPRSSTDIISQIEHLNVFLAMQITRSLRYRKVLNIMGKEHFASAIKSFPNVNESILEEFSKSHETVEDVSLLMSLRHIILHYLDLRSRSIIFINADKSKVITAPDPAIFLNADFSIAEKATVNSTLLYPITRETLALFLPRSTSSESIQCHGIESDGIIEAYNRLIFQQSPKNEIYMHPEDENYVIDIIRNFDPEYNVIKT